MERGIVANDSYIKYHIIPAGKFNRSLTIKNFRNAYRVVKGVFAAKKLIRELKPDIVFSKGGFVTVPVVIAAKKSNIPVIIHESDITPGLQTRSHQNMQTRFVPLSPKPWNTLIPTRLSAQAHP